MREMSLHYMIHVSKTAHDLLQTSKSLKFSQGAVIFSLEIPFLTSEMFCAVFFIQIPYYILCFTDRISVESPSN